MISFSTRSQYFLARYPGQVMTNITTLAHANGTLKLKPKQRQIEIDVPLFGSHHAGDTLVSDVNCDKNRLEYFKSQKLQKMEGVLQADNRSNRL